MKKHSNLGFSALHILPVIAVIAIVAVVGVRIFNKSHAFTSSVPTATNYSCSIYFGNRRSDGGIPFILTQTNKTSNLTINARYVTIRKNGGILRSVYGQTLGPHQSSQVSDITYPGGTIYTLTATWAYGSNSGYCGGTRAYK